GRIDDDVVLVRHDDAGYDQCEASCFFEPSRAEIACKQFPFTLWGVGKQPYQALRRDGLRVVTELDPQEGAFTKTLAGLVNQDFEECDARRARSVKNWLSLVMP